MTSLPPGHPALRARICEIIARKLANENQSEIARSLGCAETTPGRRGDDYRAWFGDGLELALNDRDLSHAVHAYLDGEQRIQGEAIKAPGALVREMREDGELVAAIAKTLEDGRVSRDEAKWIIDLIEKRRAAEDRDLLPSLRAIAEAT